MGDTLWDLYREAGLTPSSPATRAARQGAPPPLRAPIRSPAVAAYNARQEYRRAAPAVRADFERQAPRQAFTVGSNQIVEPLVEMTGLPSVRRAASEYTRLARGETADWSAANEQAIWGALGVEGMFSLVPRGRAPAPRVAPRATVRPSMRAEPFPDFGRPSAPPPMRPAPDAGDAALPDGGAGGGGQFDEAAIIARGPVTSRPVAEIRELVDPFADDPWELGQDITLDEVRAAMAAGAREPRSFSHQAGGSGWTRQQHIDRIATLAREGWGDDPLKMLPMGQMDDGLHRLAAAIARGDDTIRVQQPRLSESARRELTADPRVLEAEHRARTGLNGGASPSRPPRFDGGPIGGDNWRRDVSFEAPDGVGRITYRVSPDRGTWTIHTSAVSPKLQGQGNGVALYEELLRRAQAEGVQRVTSDTTVSAAARRIYQALERRGYSVSQHPRAVTGDAGDISTSDFASGPGTGSPVYTIELRTPRSPPDAAKAYTRSNKPPRPGGFLLPGAN